MAELNADVVIVGAGTSGTYLAWKLAEAGYRCLVLERDRLENLGTSIGPFHMEEAAFERFGIPLPCGDELLHTARTITMWPPGAGESVTARIDIMVMDKPLFMRRLHSYAREAGAEFVEEVEVTGLVVGRGFPCGVKARGASGEMEVLGRLLVDASGIEGALRTRMPASPWFESDPIIDLDTLIVYMETWRDIKGDIRPDVNSYLHFQGWYAPAPGDTRIVGVGMPASPEGAKKRQQAFAAGLPFEGEVESSTGGRVPYRRPPYSLVDNGLVVVGDAAFMNKPFSGEGVISALAACRIVSEVAAGALARDDVSREALWPCNVRFFRDQGAKFAFLTAVMPAVVSLSEEEIDFLFTVPGIITEEGTKALNLEYELKSDPVSTLKSLPALLKGIAVGKLRPGSIASITRMGLVAGSLKKLYERYPEHPVAFGAWVDRVSPLWLKADRARYDYFEELLRQWA